MDRAASRKKQNKGSDPRSTQTINGRIAMLRRHYHSQGQGSSTPSDDLLDAMHDTISQATRDLCVQLNRASRGFAMTAGNLLKAAQLSLSRETIRQAVETDGKAVLALARSGELQPVWRAVDCKVRVTVPIKAPANTPVPDPIQPPAAPTAAESVEISRIYVSSDGFTAPIITDAEKQARRQKVIGKRKLCDGPKRPLPPVKRGSDGRYKEFKAVMFFDHDLKHRQVAVTRGDCDALGKLMMRDAARLGFRAADERVGLIDGGPWIINQMKHRGLKTTAVGLDFYHLGENVHKTRRIVFGEADEPKTDPGSKWAAGMMHAAKHEGYEPIREKIMELRGKHRQGKRKEIDRLLEYTWDRRGMIRYDEFIANGWHIGSGAMESQCRVIPDRVKGPGKRWDPDNGEAIMALEALYQSGQSAAYRLLAMNRGN